jgi:hypothetical protein
MDAEARQKALVGSVGRTITAEGGRVIEQSDFSMTIMRGRPVHHRLHFLLGAGVGGFFALISLVRGPLEAAAAFAVMASPFWAVWLFLVLTRGEHRTVVSVDEDGRISRSAPSRRERAGNALLWRAGAIVVAVIAAAILVSFGRDFMNPPAPTCDGQTMSWGDLCVSASSTSGGLDYGGEQASEQVIRLIVMVVSGIVALAAGLTAALMLLLDGAEFMQAVRGRRAGGEARPKP